MSNSIENVTDTAKVVGLCILAAFLLSLLFGNLFSILIGALAGKGVDYAWARRTEILSFLNKTFK